MSHGEHGSSEFRRNLYGWFGVACRQEILEEIFFKEWPEARNNSIQLAFINIIFKNMIFDTQATTG